MHDTLKRNLRTKRNNWKAHKTQQLHAKLFMWKTKIHNCESIQCAICLLLCCVVGWGFLWSSTKKDGELNWVLTNHIIQRSSFV